MMTIDSEHNRLPLSEELKRLSPAEGIPHTTLRELLEIAEDRGPALLILMLSIPFCLPIPMMGLSTPFGAAILYFSLALIHHNAPRLPKRLMDRPIPSEQLRAILSRTIKILVPIEKMIHPVGAKFCLPLQVPTGILIVWLSILLSLPLPIPTTNMIPSIPIILLSLGLLERNFICLILGWIGGIIATGLFGLLFWATYVLGKSGTEWMNLKF